MQRTARKQTVRRPSPTVLSYARVEAALAKVFDVEDAQHGAFRGRLKHFRKLGIPAETPGKGSRLQYTPSDLFQLLVALELSEFDIDPTLIVQIVQRHWKLREGFFETIRLAQQLPSEGPSGDWLVVMRPWFMSASLGQRRIMQSATGISVRSAPNPVEIQFVLARNASNILIPKPGERLCVFNLSARIRAVEQALAVK
jgi:hypothetical protein